MNITLKVWNVQDVLTEVDLNGNFANLQSAFAFLEDTIFDVNSGETKTISGNYTVTEADHKNILISQTPFNHIYLPILSSPCVLYVVHTSSSYRPLTSVNTNLIVDGVKLFNNSYLLYNNRGALLFFPLKGSDTNWYGIKR